MTSGNLGGGTMGGVAVGGWPYTLELACTRVVWLVVGSAPSELWHNGSGDW